MKLIIKFSTVSFEKLYGMFKFDQLNSLGSSLDAPLEILVVRTVYHIG